ncbi:MAG: tRNA 2-thiouridine(34) synthase MnmA, partial [Calditrichaeota bacterium]|nr:tRNA 2-thiouridine(34) synthase MnmA [Calditrichota bacterium]
MRDTAVLLSGGVDSSVALRLLQRAGGHRLTAWYLKIWLQEELAFLGDCPWEDDLDAARAVCQQADVPLEVLPLQKEYWERVVSYVLDELRAGGTPSPDLLC